MPSSALSSTSSSVHHNGNKQVSKLTEHLNTLELGIEFKLDLRAEDLEPVQELGAGNGGTVTRVRHIPTGAIMARKVRLCCFWGTAGLLASIHQATGRQPPPPYLSLCGLQPDKLAYTGGSH